MFLLLEFYIDTWQLIYIEGSLIFTDILKTQQLHSLSVLRPNNIIIDKPFNEYHTFEPSNCKHHLQILRKEMEGKSNCQSIPNKDTRNMQDFMVEKSLENSRMEVLWLTNMLDTRTTMKAKYNQQYSCPHCADGRESGILENPLHLMECRAYADLRQGINPELVQKDRPGYLRRVITRRKELEANLKKTTDN